MKLSIYAAAAFAVIITIASCSTPASPAPATPAASPAVEKMRAAGPCGIVDDATRAQFSIGIGTETIDPVVVGSRECTWSTPDRRVYYMAVLPDSMDLDSVLRGYEEPVASTIAGKRAAQTYSSRTFKDRECLVFVEDEGMHLLNFQYEPASEERSSTHAQVCEKATAFAERVIASL
ncbi:MAG: hypothetical protein ABT15_00085 [Pseudonocardia sp. SCN 73-27]|nr:MAG: hypothetical protein ABT15_00085 [Pseudonocardia sp. SCN 73-27]